MKVFLSHSSRDKDMARRVAIDLTMSSVSVWLDEWEILVGDPISQKVSRGLEDCELVIVLLSAASAKSGWVQKEWASRIGEEAESQDAVILPVLIEDCEVPALLRDKLYADLRHNYSAGFRRLAESIAQKAAGGDAVGVGARITSGRIVFERTNPPMPVLQGMIISIEQGCFVRHENRLQAHVHTVGPRKDFQEWAEQMGLSRLQLVSEDLVVSRDPESPTVFVETRSMVLPRGHRLTDFGSGQAIVLPFELRCSYTVEVRAACSGDTISGSFVQTAHYSAPSPIRQAEMRGVFSASVALDS